MESYDVGYHNMGAYDRLLVDQFGASLETDQYDIGPDMAIYDDVLGLRSSRPHRASSSFARASTLPWATVSMALSFDAWRRAIRTLLFAERDSTVRLMFSQTV